MKSKVLSLFLVLIMLFSFSCVSANGAYFYYTQSIEEITLTGSTLTVKTAITSNGSIVESFNGYCAVYSSEGILKAAATLRLTEIDSSAVYEIKNYSYASDDYIKAFLWYGNHSPIAEVAQENVPELEVLEGIILETYLSDPYYEEGDNTVSLLVTKSSSASYEAGKAYDIIASLEDAMAYLGFSVMATVKDNTFLSVVPAVGMNKLVTIDTNEINYIEEDVISYYETPSSKYDTEAEIHTSVTVGGITTDTSDNFIVINGLNNNYNYTSEFFDYYYHLDTISLLDNDNDGAFEFIYATVPTNDAVEFVVESAEVSDGLYLFSGEKGDFELDTTEPDFCITVIKDGVITTPDAIVKDDVITCLDASVNILTVYASSSKVIGTVEEIDDDIYTINGVDYKLSPLSGLDIYAGTTSTFYLNAFGEIANIKLPPLNYHYFYITDTAIEEDSFNGTNYLVKGINESGEEAIYTLRRTKVDIYTPDDNVTKVTDDTAYAYIEEYRGIAKIVLDDNSYITTVVLPDASDDFLSNIRYESDAEDMSSKYNETRSTYGIVSLSDNTLIFNVDTEDNIVTASTVGESFVHGLSYSFIAYGDENTTCALVTYDLDIPDSDTPFIHESEYVYLIDYDIVSDAFGETEYYVRVMRDSGNINPYVILPKNVSVYTKDSQLTALTAEEAYAIVSQYIGVAKIALTNYDEIAHIYLPGCEEIVENTTYITTSATYNSAALTIGDTVLNDETMVFNIDTAEELLSLALSAHSAAKALQDGESYTFKSYGKIGESADIILTNDLDLSHIAEESVMVVTNVATILSANKETLKITGIKNGKKDFLIVDPKEAPYVDIEIGNVIIYTEKNDYVTDIQVLFTSTSTGEGELCEDLDGILTSEYSYKSVTIHYGEIIEKKSKYIILDDEYKYYFYDEVNVIVVDYTGANTNISAGSLSNVKASSAKYKRTAFVKTCCDTEDEITDIVVFITAS